MTTPQVPLPGTITPDAADSVARHLRAFHRTLARLRRNQRGRGARGPRDAVAMGLSLATLVLAIAVAAVLGLSPLASLGTWLGAPALVYVGLHRFSGLPATWDDELDAQLASYVPLDAVAYRALQTDTRAANSLHPELVEAWLERESQALGQLQREQAPRKRYRFWENQE